MDQSDEESLSTCLSLQERPQFTPVPREISFQPEPNSATNIINETEEGTTSNNDDSDNFLMTIVRDRCQVAPAGPGEKEAEVPCPPKEKKTTTIANAKTTPAEASSRAASANSDESERSEDTISISKRPYTTSDHNRVKVRGDNPLVGDHQQVMLPGAYAVAVTSGAQETSRVDGTHELSTSTIRPQPDVVGTDRDLEQGQLEEPSESAKSVVEDAILVEEMPIQEAAQREGHTEVIEGRILQVKSQQIQRSERWQLLLVVVVLGGALTLLLSLLLPPSDSTSHDKEDGLPTLYPPYAEGLSGEIMKGIQEVGSSYYKANAWMVQDQFLETYSAERQKQRFLMAYFYFQSNGQEWFRNDHWLSYNVSECEWFFHNSSLQIGGWNPGMEPEPVCDSEGNLRVMNLTSNNLSGTSIVQTEGISPELLIFDVSNNDIKGPMPPVAAHAKNMEVFIMSNNKLQGQITGGHGMSAFNQRIVKLDGNQLLGHFPLICTILPRLELINTTGNLFDQDLRHFLGCKNMSHLILADNLFKSSIPSEVGLMTSLKELDVSKNAMMTGTIPSELGLLDSLSLLDVTETQIQGEVPAAMCSRSEEKQLQIAANCTSVQCCQ